MNKMQSIISIRLKESGAASGYSDCCPAALISPNGIFRPNILKQADTGVRVAFVKLFRLFPAMTALTKVFPNQYASTNRRFRLVGVNNFLIVRNLICIFAKREITPDKRNVFSATHGTFFSFF